MIERLLNLLRHGCAHEHTSWPLHVIRIVPAQGPHIAQTHRHSLTGTNGQERCLDCGMFRFAEIGGARGEWLRDVSTRKVVNG